MQFPTSEIQQHWLRFSLLLTIVSLITVSCNSSVGSLGQAASSSEILFGSGLAILDGSDLHISGPPFPTDAARTYQIENRGTVPATVTVDSSGSHIDVDNESVEIAPGAIGTFSVSLNSAVYNLAIGNHPSTINIEQVGAGASAVLLNIIVHVEPSALIGTVDDIELPMGTVVGKMALRPNNMGDFVLHGTMPVPRGLFPRNDGANPIHIVDADGNMVEAQTEVVSWYPNENNGADVIEIIAPVSEKTPSSNGLMEYDVVFKKHIPPPFRSTLPPPAPYRTLRNLDPKTHALLDNARPLVLRVYGHDDVYEANLLGEHYETLRYDNAKVTVKPIACFAVCSHPMIQTSTI